MDRDRGRQWITAEQTQKACPRHPLPISATKPLVPDAGDLMPETAQGRAVAGDAIVAVVAPQLLTQGGVLLLDWQVASG